MLKVYERYTHDPVFRALVDQLTCALLNGNFTPTEVREAAMLAQLKFEEMVPRRTTFTKKEVILGEI